MVDASGIFGCWSPKARELLLSIEELAFLVILFLSVNLSVLWRWQPQCKTRGSKSEQPARGNLLSQGSVFSGGSSGVLESVNPA